MSAYRWNVYCKTQCRAATRNMRIRLDDLAIISDVLNVIAPQKRYRKRGVTHAKEEGTIMHLCCNALRRLGAVSLGRCV
jgi:hypothetical protein